MTVRARARVAALEDRSAAHDTAIAIIADARAPRARPELRELLLDLLAAKLEASRAVADAARAALNNPAWLARQDAAGLEALGAYLDRSAFNLGDRLAGTPKSEEAE